MPEDDKHSNTHIVTSIDAIDVSDNGRKQREKGKEEKDR